MTKAAHYAENTLLVIIAVLTLAGAAEALDNIYARRDVELQDLLLMFLYAEVLRPRPEITAPSDWSFCSPAASQKGLHIPSVALPHDATGARMDMRPFLRLAAGQNPGAIRLTYFLATPKS